MCLVSVYLSRRMAPVRLGFLSCSPGCPQSTAQGQTEETLNQICKVNPGKNDDKGTQSSSSWACLPAAPGAGPSSSCSLRPVRYWDWPVLLTERRLSLSKSALPLSDGAWWGAEGTRTQLTVCLPPYLPPSLPGPEHHSR